MTVIVKQSVDQSDRPRYTKDSTSGRMLGQMLSSSADTGRKHKRARSEAGREIEHTLAAESNHGLKIEHARRLAAAVNNMMGDVGDTAALSHLWLRWEMMLPLFRRS
jgi:hypothetical protein